MNEQFKAGGLNRDNAIRDFVDRRNLDPEYKQDDAYTLKAFIDGYDFAIKSQQSRIELLESAIREYENVNCELAKLSYDDRMNERNSAKYLKAYYAMIGLIKPNGE